MRIKTRRLRGWTISEISLRIFGSVFFSFSSGLSNKQLYLLDSPSINNFIKATTGCRENEYSTAIKRERKRQCQWLSKAKKSSSHPRFNSISMSSPKILKSPIFTHFLFFCKKIILYIKVKPLFFLLSRKIVILIVIIKNI